MSLKEYLWRLPEDDRTVPALLAETEKLKKEVGELEPENLPGSSGLNLSGQQDFKTFVENTPGIISRQDRDLRHSYSNPAIERVTGLPAQRVGDGVKSLKGKITCPLYVLYCVL